MIKRFILPLVLTALVLLGGASAFARSDYRYLKCGDRGDDVLQMKTALFQLGYFNTQNLSGEFSEITKERVARFQADHGLPQTGEASPEMQAYLFALLKNPKLTPPPGSPAPSPGPSPVPGGVSPSPSPSPYRTLQEGDSGEEVLALKHALYYLGYFSTLDVSDRYNAIMTERIRLLQKNNGLRQTGIADPALQALIYSGDCVKTKTAPTPTPAPIGEKGLPVDFPDCTAEGFLNTEGEYVYQNEDEGLWLYASPTLAIQIRRMEDKKAHNVWFETDIRCSAQSPLCSFVNWNEAKTNTIARNPVSMAQAQQSVLLLSDDHFGARLHAQDILGICIRSGETISAKTLEPLNHHFPNRDTLAVLGDGSMRADLCGEVTAEEYENAGAREVLCFGPVLVQNGALNERVLTVKQNNYKNPRTALGMISPYHYLALTVNGRGVQGQGVNLEWLANKMLEKGATEAINLDGGGTTCLIFMGNRLNHSGSDIRYLYSCISFGTSPLVQ